jgi:hypothetical protein
VVAAAQAVRRDTREQVIAGCRLLRSPMAKEAGLYGGGNSDIPTRARGRPPQEMSPDGTRTQSGEPGVEDGDPDHAVERQSPELAAFFKSTDRGTTLVATVADWQVA